MNNPAPKKNIELNRQQTVHAEAAGFYLESLLESVIQVCHAVKVLVFSGDELLAAAGHASLTDGRLLSAENLARISKENEQRGGAAKTVTLGGTYHALILSRNEFTTVAVTERAVIFDPDVVLGLVLTTVERLYFQSLEKTFNTLEPSSYWAKREPLLSKLSKSSAPVHLSGPVGSGKDFVARHMHSLSGRPGRFVHVHLPSLSEELFELELFGAKKGAFTGAEVDRQGRFSYAQHGTIYLDDITGISISLQAKLLRVLEDGSFTPVGSNSATMLDLKIISSTSTSLIDKVRDGSFREDLMYRINVLPLTIPPIAERREDIVFFVDQFAARIEKEEARDEFLARCKALNANAFPGNIRQLLSTLERLSLGIPDVDTSQVEGKKEPALDLKTALNIYKKDLIRDILLRCSGNVTEAARILDIQRTYLSRLIRELSIYPEQER